MRRTEKHILPYLPCICRQPVLKIVVKGLLLPGSNCSNKFSSASISAGMSSKIILTVVNAVTGIKPFELIII